MKRMNDDLDELKDLAVRMGDLALSMVRRSVEALENGSDITEDMRSEYSAIKDLDAEIETKAFRILMLYQPMSGDMRFVATVLKMITYMERIGKYGYSISKNAKDLNAKGLTEFGHISQMGSTAMRMTEGVISALDGGSVSLLDGYEDMENELDSMRRTVLRDSLEHMKERPEDVDLYNNYISISRYLERIGDHVCKLAEKIMFMETGKYPKAVAAAQP